MSVQDRRRSPRILPARGCEVDVRHADDEHDVGRLIDASTGGLAFATEAAGGPEELLAVDVRRIDGTELLHDAEVRVVGVAGDLGDRIVHCAFVGAPDARWLEALALEEVHEDQTTHQQGGVPGTVGGRPPVRR